MPSLSFFCSRGEHELCERNPHDSTLMNHWACECPCHEPEPPTSPRPTFPSVSDLPTLTPADATRALDALRALADNGLVDVYTSAGSNDTRWVVWSNIRWQRFSLLEWCQEWLTTSYHGQDGQKGEAQ